MPEQMDRWDELEQALLDLGDQAMVLEEFDGFVAGLLVCPELIPGGEWIAAALGFNNRQSPFKDIAHANATLALVQDYYNSVVVTLMDRPEVYRPLLPIDETNGDVIWELWIDGFAAAVDLRPQVWKTLLQGEGEAAIAMTGMMMLIEAARGEEPDTEHSGELRKAAPTMIPEWIVTLHEHRLATHKPASFADQPNPFAGTPKVGRNDPCPCGSGRKYKHCCGAN